MIEIVAGVGIALVAPQYSVYSIGIGVLTKLYHIKTTQSKSNPSTPLASSHDNISNSDQDITLEWNNIAVELLTKSKSGSSKKSILHSTSGTAKPGRLLGIFGPSGAGKSTFLDALAGRVAFSKSIEVFGSVTINKIPAGTSDQRKQAYLVQEPVFFSQLTVEETLMFAAQTNPDFRSISESESVNKSKERVQELIKKLGLVSCAHTRVGSASERGISGGERKRLALACELLGAPRLIFADEPTTGLDSFQAERVIKVLRKLADEGFTVICTVHQPSERIYEMLDDVLLIAEGGRVVYHGEGRGAPNEYFTKLNEPAPEHVSYPEHFLELLTVDHETAETVSVSSSRLERLVNAYNASVNQQISGDESPVDEATASTVLKQPVRLGLVSQVQVLFQRAWRQISRDKRLFLQRMIPAVMSALTFGWIYWQFGLSQSTILDRMGLLQVACINSAMLSLVKTLYIFPIEKDVVQREQSRGAYNVLPYMLSKLAADLPVGAIFPAVFGTTVYTMSGLQRSLVKFGSFLLIVTLESFTAGAMGLAVGAIAPSVQAAVALGPNMMTLFIVFGGYYVNAESVPWVLRWVPNISMIRWAFRALAINEFDGLFFDVSGPADAATGEQALARIGIDYAEMGGSAGAAVRSSIGYQMRILGAFYCLTYCLLVVKKPKYAEPKVKQSKVEIELIEDAGGDQTDHIAEQNVAETAGDKKNNTDVSADATSATS
uniref:Probable ATP-dependent transporter ycf16 n=1 Tax=Timspurckia oligopyrenoides TaxID=708627 RepID=A0A7S1ERH2_9RHOD|mmetsp:Transcript_2462/g.4339  ORF Transcript_2462/g.4339 Transcript_2462/m.4339 type:complete len:720 (+) Transcript_2462:80-2239(+)|eukprot:CAMPEP_0182441260 /NCGR_PEP_ID=MMETSP1172-20130603/201_1 /TAXON_ID=708627 /ORGANISM="Timspurckia oligopyrenoides, Strain CCMP3278" /LENGTH=719 /DNA_ID=CAMNT_0024635439 /DNA_START=40 /DNA_END=2199 /DNA_ORIENTATION=+